ncbi:MAG: DUF853 family protein [Pseudomonadales bacterium]
MDEFIVAGDGNGSVTQRLAMSNRHGLIAGATGTGKTVTLQVMAESFARAGVPVFAVDAKGDLSGISQPGREHKEIDRRVDLLSLTDFKLQPYPTVFWDIFAKNGHPVRTTISEMGPDILGTLLGLNETQTGVLYACFAIADDDGMLLLDLKDLRSMLSFVADNAKLLQSEYGNISRASVGAIQRKLLVLEQQGAEQFFGEPALRLVDLMQRDFSGNGVVGLLHAAELVQTAPKLYAAFLLWLISELFEELPEAGEVDRPKIVLFIDEAHLLFKGMPSGLMDKIEQVFRLIRSKGVGIYLISQSPRDIPENILGQIGLKVQHALRAFTATDQRTVRAVADGFRNDHGLDNAQVVTQLGVGEALVSTLDEKGAPTPVLAGTIPPPRSQIGPVTKQQRKATISNSPMHGRYEESIDRESAFELLAAKAAAAAERAKQEELREEQEERREQQEKKSAAAAKRSRKTTRRSSRSRQGVGEAFLKSAVRSVGRSLGSKLVRGLLGSLLK